MSLFALLAIAAIGAAAPPAHPVISFGDPDAMRLLRANSTRLEQVASLAGGTRRALRVTFLPSEWPNVAVAPAGPWDWSGFDGLAVDITNPGNEAVDFGVRVDDDASANGVVHCRQGGGTIGAGQTASFVLPVGRNPMDFGMRGLPTAPGFVSLGSQTAGPIDLRHIVAFQIFLHSPPRPVALIVDDARLIQWTLSLDGIVDDLGQYTRATWPGKAKSVAELRERRRAEAKQLAAVPAPPGRDRFGGWADGPKLNATGYFHTAGRDGKWWLVDPDGRLFFSASIDCIGSDSQTMLTGRERMFAWLPKADDPLAAFYGQVTGVHSGPVKSGRTFNFFGANLYRKYGPDYRRAWLDTSLNRLRAWGFNTIGNWSDWALYRNERVPYVACAGVGGIHVRVSDGQDYWGKMHDPFDPQFAADAEAAIRPVAERVRDDPWCVGWFVDNELSWGGMDGDRAPIALAYGTLGADAASSPAKRALIVMLRERYPDVAALNAAWGTGFASWQALGAPLRLDDAGTAAREADLRDFTLMFARKYFAVVRDALQKLDPHHLYLGCRFAGYCPAALQAAAELCDVVSFNIYAPRVDSKRYAFVARLGKPAIIGEFHFGALDRGMFHPGLVAAKDQKQRAQMYIDYVDSVLDIPAFVGCHWFQYVDEPLTGRWFDGENYNIGFVSVTDTPYREMVAAAKKVLSGMYERRAGRR